MTTGHDNLANATAAHSDPAGVGLESFADFAFAELLAAPLGDPGRCMNPDCQRPFNQTRDWQRYCGKACKDADEREFRRIGHKAAPALLAHRLGKYATRDPDLRALSGAARRFLGQLQSEWLRSRRARAALAREGQDA